MIPKKIKRMIQETAVFNNLIAIADEEGTLEIEEKNGDIHFKGMFTIK